MEVVAYRMANGDEILGRFDESEQISGRSDLVVLEKVRHVVVQRTAEGLAVVLMPWAFSNVDAPVEIQTSHIMATFTPSAESITSYQQQTTGIALVS